MNLNKNNKTIIYHPELSNISKTANIGDNCKIHSHVWIGDNVKIGNNCKIQSFVFIPEGIIMGDDVFVGPHVCFTNDKNPPSGRENWQTTIIKNGAKIGAGAVILPGITIEENATIGAGAVVTKNVFSNSTVVGNPAKPL
ncbi:MAG: acyltransferase [Candidatus Staskawiczbacteria bacterium]|jgi:acetyltransferase-like isoleucine patch superfamily enzyme